MPRAVMEHWPLANPAGREISVFREIRDELRSRIADLMSRLPAG